MMIAKNGSVTGNSTSELFYSDWHWLLAVGDLRVNGIFTMNGTTDYVSVQYKSTNRWYKNNRYF
jgi:hypothetical protein